MKANRMPAVTVARSDDTDGEFPARDTDEVLNFFDLDRPRFDALCEEFRSPHLWERTDGAWRLRHRVSAVDE